MRGFRFRVFTARILKFFSPVVSSAEQRVKNLWYPGYLRASLNMDTDRKKYTRACIA